MSWVDKITAAHRQVFDAPEMSDGMALRNARTWMRGYADVYGTKDTDVNAVLVIRHIAVPMVMQDELWAAMEYGKQYKLADPTTGAPATRNPFINLKPGDSHGAIDASAGLDTLMSRGVIVLACNLALDRSAGELAAKTKVPREDARRRLFEHLVPGVIVVPSGIFGVARAQEAGCHYLRAT